MFICRVFFVVVVTATWSVPEQFRSSFRANYIIAMMMIILIIIIFPYRKINYNFNINLKKSPIRNKTMGDALSDR